MNNSFTLISKMATHWYKLGFSKAGQYKACAGFVPLIMLLLLVSCSQGAQPTERAGAIYREETVVLPTKRSTPKPSPPSTRVLPPEVLTPSPTLTITPIPDESLGLVVEVIDGDTIAVVLDGDPVERAYEVRYLGIDAPMNVSGDPWGIVAYETNRKLVNLKIVRLVRDETDFDDEGYLLRYVYLDNRMLSIILAEQGLVRANIVEPNTRFETEILDAQTRARTGRLGLWSQRPPTPTPGAETEEETEEPPIATSPPTATTASTTETEPGQAPTAELTATSTATATLTTPQPTAEGTAEIDLRGP